MIDKPSPSQSPTSVIPLLLIPLPFSAHPQDHSPFFTAQIPILNQRHISVPSAVKIRLFLQEHRVNGAALRHSSANSFLCLNQRPRSIQHPKDEVSVQMIDKRITFQISEFSPFLCSSFPCHSQRIRNATTHPSPPTAIRVNSCDPWSEIPASLISVPISVTSAVKKPGILPTTSLPPFFRFFAAPIPVSLIPLLKPTAPHQPKTENSEQRTSLLQKISHLIQLRVPHRLFP